MKELISPSYQPKYIISTPLDAANEFGKDNNLILNHRIARIVCVALPECIVTIFVSFSKMQH